MTQARHWRAYWAGRVDPGHRHDSPQWLALCARDLVVHFPERPDDALDLGCGNGTLYPYFRDRCRSYVGLDFSPAMLSDFRRRWEDARLVCADAASLPFARERFDLIFSNGLCQYLDANSLRRHLDDVRRVLRAGGMYLTGNIPDAELRLLYYRGALREDRRPSWAMLLRTLAKSLRAGHDGIGTWYSRRDIGGFAAAAGFACRTHSSMCYEYRFHAVLTKGV